MPYTTTFDNGGHEAAETALRNYHQRLPREYSERCMSPDLLPSGANYGWSSMDAAWLEDLRPPRKDYTEVYLKAVLIPVFIWGFAGLCESWFWFGRHMRNRRCQRGNTVI